MKLSDVVSAMNLPIFAEIPLLLFMGIFVGVALHLLRGPDHFSAARSLPLQDERLRAGRRQP